MDPMLFIRRGFFSPLHSVGRNKVLYKSQGFFFSKNLECSLNVDNCKAQWIKKMVSYKNHTDFNEIKKNVQSKAVCWSRSEWYTKNKSINQIVSIDFLQSRNFRNIIVANITQEIITNIPHSYFRKKTIPPLPQKWFEINFYFF